MKVLITGAAGQVGQALIRSAPDWAKVSAFTRTDLDIRSAKAVGRILARERPELVINAAAYTHVDAAEIHKETAFAINGQAVAILAATAADVGAKLVTISTDFVFDGRQGKPYSSEALPNPINVYGRSKLEGERAAGAGALVVRSAWIYSATGQNFVGTVLRLAQERDELRMVDDQVGTPTHAASLAQGIWRLCQVRATGIFHFTDSGCASWYDFAVAIQEEAITSGLLTKAVPIRAVPSSSFAARARRPHFSVLSKEKTWEVLDQQAPHWRSNLRKMLKELRANG